MVLITTVCWETLKFESPYLHLQAVNQQNQPYGVPIPPPLVPHEEDPSHHPLPPQRSTSSSGGQQRSRGKRSRHAGTSSRNSAATTGDIHYPKYYPSYGQQADACQYTTKYGEDCHFGSQQQGKCAYNKTWPKQHCAEEDGRVFTQDDQQVTVRPWFFANSPNFLS